MSLKPTYLIELDPRKNYMRLTFSGYMDHATLDRFEQELAAAFERMPLEGGRPGDYLLLNDARASNVQSQDITARFQACIAQYGPLVRRIAMLMSQSPLEMMQAKRVQAKRVAAGHGTAFFLSEEDALAWLFGDEDDATTPV
ncbi:hypothetical protein [uncultured Sphingomonas sp.]|uniref:hypothetical protein n=1 Tax=uncultured Sphingomonas sp. TaxID=158754 RepID=UPI0035C9A1AB